MFHEEWIECPECMVEDWAKVEHWWPFNAYVHNCKSCGYVITESDWYQVPLYRSNLMRI